MKMRMGMKMGVGVSIGVANEEWWVRRGDG